MREVDIGVDRALLDAAPGVALKQTRAIAAQVAALADGQDFILDNISNTLAVARDAAGFVVDGISAVMPVIYGVHNVILRSDRTSDIANLAALDPLALAQITPLDDRHFPGRTAATAMQDLAANPDAILLSTHMSHFLRAPVGTRMLVLLARGMRAQTEVELEIISLYDRPTGFPEGADALMYLPTFSPAEPTNDPAFFLARTVDQSDTTLEQVLTALHSNVVQIDTRLTALAKDQSSLAALNIGGLLQLDQGYALAMGAVTVAIFVFGLLLQRRREYVTCGPWGCSPPRSAS